MTKKERSETLPLSNVGNYEMVSLVVRADKESPGLPWRGSGSIEVVDHDGKIILTLEKVDFYHITRTFTDASVLGSGAYCNIKSCVILK
jgi:hypothetical protein